VDTIQYRLLGPLEVVVDGRPAKLGGPHQRAVLVALLAQADSVVPSSRLVDELWGENPPPTAANLVQGYISHLRKALGKNAIETHGTGYVLHGIPPAASWRASTTATRSREPGCIGWHPGCCCSSDLVL
jgi:DNA-binding SARP family transcriptional activator